MVTIPYWFIRYGLPVGFLLLATIGILVVRSSLHGVEAAARAARPAPPRARAAPKRQPVQPTRASDYSVRSGDTLGAIADRFGTSVARLLALNPGIDPRALRVGQTVHVE